MTYPDNHPMFEGMITITDADGPVDYVPRARIEELASYRNDLKRLAALLNVALRRPESDIDPIALLERHGFTSGDARAMDEVIGWTRAENGAQS